MSRSKEEFSVIVSESQTRAIQEALKPHIRAVGVRTVERRLRKRSRFFQNARLRGSLRLKDFLALCAVLELEPVEFIKAALRGDIMPEIRPPGILLAAWRQLKTAQKGIGSDRVQQLQSTLYIDPRGTRAAIKRLLPCASPNQVPLILGLYASAFRLESDLPRATLLLREARRIARDLNLPAAEADLLIRLSYVALEREDFPQAIRYAEQGTLIYSRLEDGRGP